MKRGLALLYAGLGCVNSACIEYVDLAQVLAPPSAPWALAHVVKPRRDESNAKFGASVTLTDGQLLVGAPASADCGGATTSDLDCPGGKLSAWSRPLGPRSTLALLDPVASRDILGVGSDLAAMNGEVWVGAPGTTPDLYAPGAVISYRRDTGRWTEPAPLEFGELPDRAWAGYRVALAEAWGAAYVPRMPCPEGRPGEKGVVFVYAAQRDGWALAERICIFGADIPITEADAREYGDITIVDDELVVGVPWSFEGSDGARLLVYRLAPEGARLHLQARLPTPEGSRSDHFGYAVAAEGDTIFVGAPNDGAVYVFERDQYVLRPAQRLSSPMGPGSRFGAVLAVDRGTLVVGAPGDHSCALGIDPPEGDPVACDTLISPGAAHVFGRDADGLWRAHHYVKPPNPTSAAFGSAVAIRDGTFAVGDPLERTEGRGIDGPLAETSSARGAVFVYERQDELEN